MLSPPSADRDHPVRVRLGIEFRFPVGRGLRYENRSQIEGDASQTSAGHFIYADVAFNYGRAYKYRSVGGKNSGYDNAENQNGNQHLHQGKTACRNGFESRPSSATALPAYEPYGLTLKNAFVIVEGHGYGDAVKIFGNIPQCI